MYPKVYPITECLEVSAAQWPRRVALPRPAVRSSAAACSGPYNRATTSPTHINEERNALEPFATRVIVTRVSSSHLLGLFDGFAGGCPTLAGGTIPCDRMYTTICP